MAPVGRTKFLVKSTLTLELETQVAVLLSAIYLLAEQVVLIDCASRDDQFVVATNDASCQTATAPRTECSNR